MRSLTFQQLMEIVEPLEPLQEVLTFDQLFKMSEPKRGIRADHVHMPPLEMEQYQTPNHWVFAYFFNAKSDPGWSTTGLRHRGFIRFRKPKRGHKGENTPLALLPVEVDCMCPDYRYRWAWANHQKRAGPIGPSSLNQCIARAPRKTNPLGKPGLCKHILATREYIYGLLTGFPENVGPADRLDKLTRRATRRWLNLDAEIAAARERDAQIAAAKARRNIGVPPPHQGHLINHLEVEEPPPLPELPDVADQVQAPQPPQPPQPPQAPVPPTVAAAHAPERRARTPLKSKPKSKLKPKPKTKTKAQPPAAPPRRTFLKQGRFSSGGSRELEGVDSMKNMKTLSLQENKRTIQEARRLINEIAGAGLPDDDEGLPDDTGAMPPPSGEDMPMEPPISDSAIGASTQDNVALGLLGEIRDLLAELVGQEGAEADVPPMPDEDLDAEGLGDEEGPDREDDEDFQPGKRPMPVPSGVE
jgi:hypothetical protein